MGNNKFVVGNMKMNMTVPEISRYLKEIDGAITSNHVILCPTNLYSPYFLKQSYQVGCQTISEYDMGSYTGEVSAVQAVSMGIRYTLIGHSERRVTLHETDTVIAHKMKKAIESGMQVILCIGESLEEFHSGMTKTVLTRQIQNSLIELTQQQLSQVMIAYEPIWAIGSGIVPTNEEIEDVILYIKQKIKETFDIDYINVLYGGSVNDKNINELSNITSIDGVLVGGASLDAHKFLKIIEVVLSE